MPKFDATINGISLASYGVEPNMATVPQPDAKTYQAEIPGRDGLLDYTDAYGVVRYENRTVTVEAYEIGDITARMEHRRAICSDMHGKTCTLALTTLPGYTFTGRCSVEYDEDGSETAYKLSFDCQPYMSAGERTFYANCAGGVDLVFMSGDKPVKPRIEVPRRSIIVFNGQQYEVEAGTWTFDGILFKRGRNEVYINTYTEPGTTTWGDLESMTWEQIGWHHKTADASGALVNVTDALQARPNKLGVDGKAVQVVTTGKNLCPVKSGTSYGVTATVNADGSMTLNGTATMSGYITLDGGFYKDKVPIAGSLLQVGKKYCVSGGIASNVDVVFVTYSETGYVTSIFNSGTVPANDLYYGMFLYIYTGVEFTNTVIYPQIEQAEVATAWEPYTGGKPSPNPEYPQEVDVVDSPVSVQVVGKNLLRYPYNGLPRQEAGLSVTANADGSVTVIGTPTRLVGIYLPGLWSAGATLKPGTYTFSAKGKESNTRLYVSTKPIGAADGAATVIANTLLDAVTFTISEEVAYTAQMNVDPGSAVNFTFYPQIEVGATATPYEPYTSTQQTITLPPNHNYLASLPDGTRDELVLRSDGVAVLTKRVGKRVFNGTIGEELQSINSAGIANVWIKNLGEISSNTDSAASRCSALALQTTGIAATTTEGYALATVGEIYLRLKTSRVGSTLGEIKAWLSNNPIVVFFKPSVAIVRYSADNGTTWSTTDPNAGNSAIQLHKGTNNVWCTDALSPNVTLNYDTQERTRKQRISELYWLGNEPKKRLTWGQLATHTWKEIGSKSIQEWYFSGTAEVVENAYINYEIGEL